MTLRNYFIRNRFAKGLFLERLQNPHCSVTCFNIIKKMSDQASSSSASSSEESNQLKSEKSPYLLQHQHNPVHWYPWGEEAFTIARNKKKPIFLSVGYSTCHWCHVMERESFEKDHVAEIMNKYFVNIKMDREERPDIDRIYMTFVQAVSGSGGWPMSVWMTSDLKPFYGGTYYPPEDHYGRPGFKSLLLTIADQWKENSEKFITSADKILDVLERTASLPKADKLPIASEMSSRCLQQLGRSYEPAFGGFSDHPKFPQPVNLSFLIYHRKANPDSGDALKMVDKTLKMIAKGGIHDHVGKGFCRYSTDKKWHVPHFEKMLYDNAQLATANANAFLLTSDAFFSKIVADILEYVERDLSHNEGGFYSAEDADSYPSHAGSKNKVEGAFYVWTKAETDEIFGSRKLTNGTTTLSEMFHWRYGIRENGNVDPHQDPHDELKHKNVLYIAHSVDETAKKFNLQADEIRTACTEAKQLLFSYRNQNRPRPGLDTKIIASWNGLMISAFARSGCALNNQGYIDRAVKAMNFVKTYLMSPTGSLYRTCYRDGDDNDSPVINLKEPILACVDDYANLVCASLDLFDATWNLDYLRLAITLQKKQDEIFLDTEKGGYFNSRMNRHVIVRFKDDDDGAEPSSNSTSAVNLVRLWSITDNPEYKTKLLGIFQQFSDRLMKVPMTLPLMVAAYESFTAGTKFILILTKSDGETETVAQIRRRLLPLGSTIVSLGVESGNLEEWKKLIPCINEKLEHFQRQDSSEVIYVRQGEKFIQTYSNKEGVDALIKSL